MNSYTAIFTRLNLAEKVRLSHYARERGFSILPIAEEVAGLTPEPIEIIPASELTEHHFPRADGATLTALRSYYALSEQRESYPPLGYAPSLRTQERDAAALMSYMATTVESWGERTIEECGYPLARIS